MPSRFELPVELSNLKFGSCSMLRMASFSLTVANAQRCFARPAKVPQLQACAYEQASAAKLPFCRRLQLLSVEVHVGATTGLCLYSSVQSTLLK